MNDLQKADEIFNKGNSLFTWEASTVYTLRAIYLLLRYYIVWRRHDE